MDVASRIISELFNKELHGGYAVLFLVFVGICIMAIIAGLYYAIGKRAVNELGNVTWLSLKDTIKYSAITIITITVFSTILFAYDFGLDKVVKLIIENAQQ
jgi:preprotein translocase SecE subunit